MRLNAPPSRPASAGFLPPASPPQTSAGAGHRQTRPSGYNPFSSGGLGLLPRRGLDNFPVLTTRAALQSFAEGSPLRLLSLLPDIHPAVGLATWNVLRLACKPGDLRIVALKESTPGAGDDRADDAATGLLNDLWDSLPAEIGGLHGLQTTLTLSALFTGLVCLEAVPGDRLRGVSAVWPVDSLTIRFGRKDADAGVTPYQRQTGAEGGLQELNPNTFFWRAVDNWPDDPYGRAPYAAALSEVLADLSLMQDLRDSIHNSAWPRLAWGFNTAQAYETATTVMGLSQDEAQEWVGQQFQQVQTLVGTLRADDNLVFDSNGKLQEIAGGQGLNHVQHVLEYLRQRITQSLKTLPTLMGINDGSTQTYTTVEWSLYAAGLESLRALVADQLVKVATLHLRLMGYQLTVKANYEKIRTSDAVQDASTETVKIQNEVAKRNLGWNTDEDASMSVTGHGPAGVPVLPVAPVAPGADVAPVPVPIVTPGRGVGITVPPSPTAEAKQAIKSAEKAGFTEEELAESKGLL